MTLLERQFGRRFQDVSTPRVSHPSSLMNPLFLIQILSQDDCLPMYVEKASERDSVLDTVWLMQEERAQLEQ